MDLIAAPGTLLLAVPQMRDPNFMHTVVLICEHSARGAVGLVVNRLAAVSVEELLPDHELLGEASFPVFSGGPVGLDSLQFVHRVPDRISGSLELSDGIHLGGELDDMARHLTQEPTAMASLRLFLGYSGWGAGQLDAELASGSWVPAPPDAGVVFHAETPEAVWRRGMRALGAQGEQLSQLPPDVTWN